MLRYIGQGFLATAQVNMVQTGLWRSRPPQAPMEAVGEEKKRAGAFFLATAHVNAVGPPMLVTVHSNWQQQHSGISGEAIFQHLQPL